MVRQPIEQFFEACEAAPPLQLRGIPRRPDGSPGTPRSWTLSAPFAVVGSDPRADLFLDDPLVSPRHCLLQVLGPKVLAIDLGSDRGLLASEGPCLAGWIEPGRDVGIGNHLLGLLAGPPESWRRPAEFPSPPTFAEVPLLSGPLPRIVLEIRARRLSTSWGMRGAIVLVGSDPSCSLRLSGPGISRFHAALVRTNRGLWVIDLLGNMERNVGEGIHVNGQPVRFAILSEGDRLDVGDFWISPRVHVARPISTGILGDLGKTATTRSSEAALAARTNRPLTVPRVVEPDERDPDTFTSDLIRLIDFQRSEIAALRRDVDLLRGELKAALSSVARQDGLTEPPVSQRPSIRNSRPRILGTAFRKPAQKLPAPNDPRGTTEVPTPVIPPHDEPGRVGHSHAGPSDALAYW
ncbi:MAG: FHA domain-containing protein [Isosphaeraceae bacterium]